MQFQKYFYKVYTPVQMVFLVASIIFLCLYKQCQRSITIYIYIYILEDLSNYVTMFVCFSKSLCHILTKLLGMEEAHPEMVLCQVACLGK